jgi:hypothetical protein
VDGTKIHEVWAYLRSKAKQSKDEGKGSSEGKDGRWHGQGGGLSLAEEELFGAEVFDCVAELGCFSEFEFLGGFAHVGFEFSDVGVEVGLGGEGETSVASFSSRST